MRPAGFQETGPRGHGTVRADKPDPLIDRAWAREAQRRWKAYKTGKVKAIPLAEVMGRIKRRGRSS